MPTITTNVWIKTSDFKPKENMTVLGWWPGEPTICYMDDNMQWWYTKHNVDGYRKCLPPAHWMKIEGPNDA